MILFCEICKRPFLWVSPLGYSGRKPKICGKLENSHWVANSGCAKKRSNLAYLKWKESNSRKLKEIVHKTYLRRKAEDKISENIKKDVPKAKQYECRRCGEFSANRFYCPDCLTILSDRIAGDEYIYTGCGATLDLEMIR